MLIKECQPGDFVEAVGWDVAISRKTRSDIPVGWLIPHKMNHKKAVELGFKSTLFYVGPVSISINDTKRKMHHFLTSDGESVCLEGNEFRLLSLCTN
jgi:hypothetical protein